MKNLERFLSIEDRLRDSAMLLGICSGFVWFEIFCPLFHIEHAPAAYSAIGIVGSVFLLRAVAYRHTLTTPTKSEVVMVRSVVARRWTMVAATAVILGALSLLPSNVVEAAVVERRLRKALSGDIGPKQIDEAKRIVDSAQRANVTVNPAIVDRLGRKLLRVSSSKPSLSNSALNAAIAFADYRSFVNQKTAAAIPTLEPTPPSQDSERHTNITIPPGTYVGGEPMLKVEDFGVSRAENAALMELISSPSTSTKPGPALTVITGFQARAGIVIDGQRMRHVILRNLEIHYHDGPLILTDVSFIGCRFVIDRQPNGIALLEQLLAGSATNFYRLKSSA